MQEKVYLIVVLALVLAFTCMWSTEEKRVGQLNWWYDLNILMG